MTRAPFTRAPLPSLEPRGYREHFCACGKFGCFGLGNRWYCPGCVPPGFLPKDRA